MQYLQMGILYKSHMVGEPWKCDTISQQSLLLASWGQAEGGRIFVKIWPLLQDLHKYGPNILGHVSLYLKIWPYTNMIQICGDMKYITIRAQLHNKLDNFPHHHVANDQSKGLTIQLIRSGREGIGRLGIKFMAHEPRLAPSSSPSYILHSATLLHRTLLVAFLHLT